MAISVIPPAIPVSSYISIARTLLQDTVDSPYRYSDSDLVVALNVGLGEIWRLRRDLFLGRSFAPKFDGADNTTDIVPLDEGYRMALVYYIVGFIQLRDDEEVQDQRAAAFLSLFNAKLGTVS